MRFLVRVPKTMQQPRKRSRASTSSTADGGAMALPPGEEENENIPNSAVLKDLVSKSFSHGDSFGGWRNRHFKTFALSYTQCAVEELLVEFNEQRHVYSVDHLHVLIGQRIAKEVADVEKRHPEYKEWMERLYAYVQNEVERKRNHSSSSRLPMRKFFYVDGGTECDALPLMVPLSKEYATEEFLTWAREENGGGYFNTLKKVCGLLQSMHIFKASSKQEAYSQFIQDFQQFSQSDHFLPDLYNLNMTFLKVRLEQYTKKKTTFASVVAKRRERLDVLDHLIETTERELESMKAKKNTLLEQSGFLDVLHSISEEECESFVSGISLIFQSKFDKVQCKLNEHKEERDFLRRESEDELKTVLGDCSSEEWIVHQIENFSRQIESLDFIFNNEVEKQRLMSCVHSHFETECVLVEELCGVMEGGQDFVKCMIKSVSKMISSKEVLLEGVCQMASHLKKRLP